MNVNVLSPEFLLASAVFAPLVAFLAIGTLWMSGVETSERILANLTAATFVLSVAAVAGLTWQMSVQRWQPVWVNLGSWFQVEGYRFPLTLLADRLSLPLLGLTVFLSGLIGSFSRRYLHRDQGFLRFFLLLLLFAFGAALAFTAGSLDLLVAGWELVGLTSVLLIAFFIERQEPVRGALRTFGIYKIADLGLLTGVFVLHHLVGSASCSTLFQGTWPDQKTAVSGTAAAVVGLLFLFAACGKSAQVPFSGWLPRAMEGPTPSSAIFYGAISVHLGVYLLLRSEALVLASPLVSGTVVLVGLLTAVHATLSGRIASDAKTSLAYVAMAQLGVIFVEVGLGFERLALLHLIGHAILRTLQFLRAPSMLHDYHRLHAAAGGHFAKTGVHYEALLPAAIRLRLYRFALDGGHLDTLMDRFVVHPALRLSKALIGHGRRAHQAGPDAPVEQPATQLVGEADA